MLRQLTREHALDADDLRAVMSAGVSREQIEDALAVCFAWVPRPSQRARSTCSPAATNDDAGD